MKHHRIVVFGLYKTGTTALFHNIKNSLPRLPRLLHEAKSFCPHPGDRETGVLAKVIVGDETVDYGSFMPFEKKVVIVRDPRDWIISGCLFLTQEIERIYLDSAAVENLVNILQEKENSPKQVPFRSILEEVLSYSELNSIDAFLAWSSQTLDMLIEFEARLSAGFRISYEDFVDRRVAELGDYLGVIMADDVSVDRQFDHVVRSGTYGNWKSWFTEEDVELFKPIFDPFLEHYGYDRSWQPADKPRLRSALGSGYVRRIVERRLRIRGFNEATR